MGIEFLKTGFVLPAAGTNCSLLIKKFKFRSGGLLHKNKHMVAHREDIERN